MKPLNKIVDTIRSLPEGIRRVLAAGVMVVLAISLFTVWSRGLSSGITALDLKSPQQVSQKTSEAQEKPAEVLSPAAGLGESFKSLNQFLGGVSWEIPSGEDLAGQTQNVLRHTAGIWNAAMDKVWRWVYAP